MSILFGPRISEIKTTSKSKRPLLRYLVDKRPEIKTMDPASVLDADPKSLHSPFLLPDILALLRILLDLVPRRILLYGDRDADGVTSTSLLGSFLRDYPRTKHHHFSFLVASESDPYGLSEPAIEKIKKESPDVLLTLDFGSSQTKEIRLLQKLGMRVVVLDHHEIPEEIVEDSLCINPRRIDSEYPEKKICTAVLSFKIVHALLLLGDMNLSGNESRNELLNSLEPKSNLWEELLPYSDLAGLGTITDMMPLSGENRLLVKLAISNWNKRPGSIALTESMLLTDRDLTSKDFGWSFGPMVNAAGRMGKTEKALELFLARNLEEAKEKAKQLVELNKERKDRTKRNLDRVERYFTRKTERTSKPLAFCFEPDMEPGVSGILATKMVELFQKTAVFVTPDHGEARGSIRAYGDENVLDILSFASDLLLHFGGHKEAAGFSVELEKVRALEERFYEAVKNLGLVYKSRSIETDFTVMPEELNEALLREWADLEPFGQGNPEVLLGLTRVKPYHLTLLSGGKHIRFGVLGSKLKFLVWNEAEAFQDLISTHSEIDIAGVLERNHFQGRVNLQFVVKNYEASSNLS